VNNSDADLLDQLMHLEVQMHKDDTRRNRDRLEKLLHPDFLEFGQSGARYTREDVLKPLDPDAVTPVIEASHFELTLMAEGVALLTYSSAQVKTNGSRHRYALRSSLWVYTTEGWRMRFHQGTPTALAILEGK
jgi:hypothetical protein